MTLCRICLANKVREKRRYPLDGTVTRKHRKLQRTKTLSTESTTMKK